MPDLFGHPIPEDRIMTPAERKALLKKRKDPRPQGYAASPGTGPEGETCGSCAHHAVRHLAKDYHKCELMRQAWTGGRKTDILVRSPACAKWLEPTGD